MIFFILNISERGQEQFAKNARQAQAPKMLKPAPIKTIFENLFF